MNDFRGQSPQNRRLRSGLKTLLIKNVHEFRDKIWWKIYFNMVENLFRRTRTKSKNKTFAHVTADKRSIRELPLNQEIISGGFSNSLTTLI